MVERDDPVDEAHSGIEVVLHQQDRAIPGGDEVGQSGVDLFDALRVEVGGRLIEHQQRRSHRERARDGQPLASAARQAVGVLATPLPQPDPAQRGLGAGEHVGHRHPQILRAEGHLVEERAGHELRVGILEDHRHARAEVGDRRRDRVDARDLDRSAHIGGHGVRDQPVEGERQRGLARPAGAEQEHDLARGDLEGDGCRNRRALSVMGDRKLVDPHEGNAGIRRERGGRVALRCGHGTSWRSGLSIS
nr:hypothetical protein GCM10025699_07500 [Microbacterium flavescens]